MAWLFLALLIGWPVIEITVFFLVADWLGLPAAVSGILLSSLIGLAVLRAQGLAIARRAQAELATGRMPMRQLFDGACLAVAGILFLLPGFVTDVVALALMLPLVRGLLRRLLSGRLRVVEAGPPVIDGEWHEVPPEETVNEDPPNLPAPDDRPPS
jgi:UPF0716 protein FxsA